MEKQEKSDLSLFLTLGILQGTVSLAVLVLQTHGIVLPVSSIVLDTEGTVPVLMRHCCVLRIKNIDDSAGICVKN